MTAARPPHEDDFRLGDWLVRPVLNRIYGASGEVSLEPRAMSVLVELKRRAGQVVTRQELHEQVWRDVAVSEETVNRTVFDLRQVLGDDARAPRYIETIRKVGYRLVAPVSDVQPADGAGVRPPKPVPARWLAAGGVALAVILALVVFGVRPGRQSPAGASAAAPRVRQLTAYNGNETHPAVSPDGSRLALAWDGGGTDNVDIYWRPVDDDAAVRLTSHPDREDNPAWAPDGKRISFVRSGRETCGLMVVHVTDQQIRKLADCREADISRPVWTPDGHGLIVADRDAPDEPFRLQRLDVKTGQVRLIGAPMFGTLGDLYPAVSPDGRRLAFVRAASKSTISTYLTPAIGDVFVVDLSSDAAWASEPTRLTFDNQVIAGLTWSAASDDVLFASTRAGLGYSIWRVPADGGDPSTVVNTTGLLRYPVRAGPGRYAYERWNGKTDIWKAPLAGSSGEPLESEALVESTRSDLNPTLSPDGTRLAFTSERTGNYEIWVSGPRGERPVQRTFFEDSPAESPAWSPDGRRLVFEVRGAEGSDLQVVGSDRGTPRPLTTGAFDDRSPTWSLDGRFIYFASNRSGSWQVWRVRDDGSEATRVTRFGGFRAIASDHAASPALYVSKRDEGGIWEVNPDGAERRLVPLAPEHWGNWTIVDGKLFFVELEDDTTVVKAHDLRSGTTTVAGRVQGWISRETPNLAITRDGNHVVLARFTGLAADLLVVEAGPR